jgi:hypothetical protein
MKRKRGSSRSIVELGAVLVVSVSRWRKYCIFLKITIELTLEKKLG